MTRRLPAFRLVSLLAISLALIVACASSKQSKSLDLALSQYEKMIRWSQWDGAADFIAPEHMKANPISRLDLDRLRLFRVTAYTIRSSLPYDEGLGFQQTVEIRMFNRNQAIERVLIDRQDWRYDDTRERWLLHSGLPDVTQAR